MLLAWNRALHSRARGSCACVVRGIRDTRIPCVRPPCQEAHSPECPSASVPSLGPYFRQHLALLRGQFSPLLRQLGGCHVDARGVRRLRGTDKPAVLGVWDRPLLLNECQEMVRCLGQGCRVARRTDSRRAHAAFALNLSLFPVCLRLYHQGSEQRMPWSLQSWIARTGWEREGEGELRSRQGETRPVNRIPHSLDSVRLMDRS
ncbi:hypothetical protein DMC30DRAFT_146442 [Rhodotorula diobovata]|uniref:Uncharacterized protein n=1 Tax=Rhodotorula diobovata TaxID=5288 RepID=A0A5C5FK06_9BASI|nr:hypothetical protein DMC30DRAFT_146442 [Rhodotorula diobovata]